MQVVPQVHRRAPHRLLATDVLQPTFSHASAWTLDGPGRLVSFPTKGSESCRGARLQGPPASARRNAKHNNKNGCQSAWEMQ